jgi:hypothetical protein
MGGMWPVGVGTCACQSMAQLVRLVGIAGRHGDCV